MKDSLILADTSIWIEAFQRSADKKIKDLFETLLLEQRIAVAPLISLELLSGAPNPAEFTKFAEELDALHQLDFTPEIWHSAAKLGFDLRRQGLSIPNTDLLLAAAAHFHRCFLWHRDKHFDLISKHFHLKIFQTS